MALTFPNRMRSYDAKSARVRFWGYDGPSEVSFFVEEGALQRMDSKLAASDEPGVLRVFDSNRSKIQERAQRAHSAKRLNSHVLAASDF